MQTKVICLQFDSKITKEVCSYVYDIFFFSFFYINQSKINYSIFVDQNIVYHSHGEKTDNKDGSTAKPVA